MGIKEKLARSAVNQKLFHTLRSFDFWANLLVIAFIIFIGTVSVMNIDPSWDSQEYHLPFAARLAGIFTKEEYTMRRMVEGYYDGMAKLAELAQGLLWRLTGMVGAANLVGLLSLSTLMMVNSVLFKIPLWQLALFYFSVPLVFRHSYSSYVDLAANALFSLSLTMFYYVLMNKKFSLKWLIAILVPLALAANTKLYQLVLSGVLALVIFAAFLTSWIKTKMRSKQVMGFLAIFLMFIVLAYWSLGINYLRFANPIYPMAFSLGEHQFPGIASAGTYTHIVNAFSIPKSNPYYFARSLAEIDLWRVLPPRMVTIDMNMAHFDPILSARMGGFFMPNLVIWGLGLLVFSLFSKNRVILKCFVLLIVLAVTASFLPSSSELRYVMFIPLTMATLFLIGLHDPARKRWYQIAAIVIQVLIFIFVAYQVRLSDYFPKAITINQYKVQTAAFEARYTVDVDSPVCLYGGVPEAFYYKLANPQLVIEFQPKQDDCSLPKVISLDEMPEYRVNP